MQQTVELASHAEASCRTDYSVHTFKTPKRESVEELYSYVYDLGEALFPTKRPLEVRKGRHYTHLYIHPIGLRFSTCQSASSDSENVEHPNYGSSLLEIPGQVWGLLNAKHRNDLICDIGGWEGLYRTTRWDPEITILYPEMGAGELVDAVTAGDIWAKGYGVHEQVAPRNLHGALKGGATQYFGARQANSRIRVYDKAAESGWETPALRVEAQLRHELANQHFKRLYRRCNEQIDNAPLLTNAEDTTVKEALSQHADLRDTSKWRGKRKPKNWAQEAPKLRWWDDALEGAYSPISVSYRAQEDLEKSVEHCAHQYGRKLFKAALLRAHQTGMQPMLVFAEFFGRCGAYLKEEDLADLLRATPEKDHQWVRDTFRECANFGHWASEHLVVQNDSKPPFV